MILLIYESPCGKRTIINTKEPLDEQLKASIRDMKARGFREIRRDTLLEDSFR